MRGGELGKSISPPRMAKDIVYIQEPGAYTIILDTPVSVEALVIGNGATVQLVFDGTTFNVGTINMTSATAITITNSLFNLQQDLIVLGSVEITGSTVVSPAAIRIETTGVMKITGSGVTLPKYHQLWFFEYQWKVGYKRYIVAKLWHHGQQCRW
jgi:hypothetical protein